MLHEDHAGRAGRRGKRLGAGLGKVEAGHHIGNDDAVGEHFGDQGLAVRLVGQRDDGVGMGMVDMPRWDQRVQDGLDRWVRRGRVHQQAALLADHLDVGERIEAGERGELFQPHRGQAGRLDGPHVPAAALDAKDFDLASVRLRRSRLNRRVAAAMQDQLRIGAKQAGGVDAGRQIGVQAGSDVAVDDGSKL